MEKRIFNNSINFFRNILRSNLILPAILVGVFVGITVVLFNTSIAKIFQLVQNFVSGFTFLQRLILLPTITTIGALISGILVFKFAPETRGSGIPYVKLTLARLGKGTRARSVIVKFLAGVAGIGTGLSLGREGPSVQIGAGLGAFVSKFFKIKGTNQHNLIASGAGAAIGATFNAPISGTIFAMEELTQKFCPATLFSTLIATVSSVSIARYFLGENPSFIVPSIQDSNLVISHCFISYVILGILAGFLGVGFAKTLYANIKIYDKIKNIPQWTKPALAGLVVGIIGVFLPYILGAGNLTINSMMEHKFALGMIVLIFIAKFFITPFCFASGAAGGIFLPMLMLGSFLGYFTGIISNHFGLDINTITISIVGMGAFLTAVARTPITAVIMVFEMTGDYHHILPVMLAVAIADLISEKLNNSPVYAELILRQGKSTPQIEFLKNIEVKKAYKSFITPISTESTIQETHDYIKNQKSNFAFIKDSTNNLAGSITKNEINDYILQGNDAMKKIECIMNAEPFTIYLNDNLNKTLFILHTNRIESLAVIGSNGKFLGSISRNDIEISSKQNKKR